MTGFPRLRDRLPFVWDWQPAASKQESGPAAWLGEEQKEGAARAPSDSCLRRRPQKLLPTVANTVALLPPPCCTVAVAPTLASRPNRRVRAPITTVV